MDFKQQMLFYRKNFNENQGQKGKFSIFPFDNLILIYFKQFIFLISVSETCYKFKLLKIKK